MIIYKKIFLENIPKWDDTANKGKYKWGGCNIKDLRLNSLREDDMTEDEKSVVRNFGIETPEEYQIYSGAKDYLRLM